MTYKKFEVLCNKNIQCFGCIWNYTLNPKLVLNIPMSLSDVRLIANILNENKEANQP